ncbi:MAG: hypothetical protein BroJett018_36490 [Chloroflexota bacterium]|nr:hypothetical protein [Chloroflexota bacterium]GIK65855.1 MAG: hypothetical protein BroJett018_36490 [Chloroflexota bacterium]
MDKIRLFESLPLNTLPPSAAVDFLHLLFFDKPALRTCLANKEAFPLLTNWCIKNDFSIQYDEEGYVCIAKTQQMARLILLVDRSERSHEYIFGKLLGYPECCCQFAAYIGEGRLNEMETEVSLWHFPKKFRIINPTAYLEGKSLICHLPCSTQCLPSFVSADKVLTFLRENRTEVAFQQWSSWLTNV